MTTIDNEYYVSLELAKLLKQLGFDRKCRRVYCNWGSFTNDGCIEDNEVGPYNWNSSGIAEQYSAPTLDVTQRWLREVYHLHITIFSSSQESWMFRITKPHQKLEDGIYGEDYYTYEEAQEASIKKALKLILGKGE